VFHLKTIPAYPVYPHFHVSYFTGERGLNIRDIDIELEGIQTVHSATILAVEMRVGGVMLTWSHAVEQASAPSAQTLNQSPFHQQFQYAIHGDPVDIHRSAHYRKYLLSSNGRRSIPDCLHDS
jgi:hypothetical protein